MMNQFVGSGGLKFCVSREAGKRRLAVKHAGVELLVAEATNRCRPGRGTETRCPCRLFKPSQFALAQHIFMGEVKRLHEKRKGRPYRRFRLGYVRDVSIFQIR